MSNDPGKPLSLNQQITGLFVGFSSRFLPKKMTALKITVCDLDRTQTVLLELEKRFDHLFVHRINIVKNASRDQKLSLALKPFLDGKKFRKDGVRVALRGHGVVIRFIHFPRMKIENLRDAIKREAEQYIPFELNNVVFDFGVVEDDLKTDDGEKMEVMLVVIKRQELEPLLEIFHNLECRLSVVDVNILAVMTALEYFHPEDFAGHTGLLDLGAEISTLGIVRDGKPRFVRDIPYGTCDLHRQVKTRSSLMGEKIEKLFEKNEVLTPEEIQAVRESLEGLIGDLRVSFHYYHDQSGQSKPVKKLFLSGGISHPAVLKALSEGLQIPVVSMEILTKIKWAPDVDSELLKTHAALLPALLGLGLRER
ncbi:MAG: pilus assembly protein PilM [Candidatus Omnitrophota bacterium]|jgi:type IV pilus assembly protein PilM